MNLREFYKISLNRKILSMRNLIDVRRIFFYLSIYLTLAKQDMQYWYTVRIAFYI